MARFRRAYRRRGMYRVRRRRSRYRRRWPSTRRDNKTYRFIQNVEKATVTATGAVQPVNYSFSLADCQQYATFDALFDQYRLKKVVFKIVPLQNVVDALNVSTEGLASVIDYDGSGPTTYTAATTYQTFKETQPMRRHTRVLYPKMLRQVYQSALSTGYEVTTGRFLDTLQPDIPHYGVTVIFPGGTSTNQKWKVICKYYLEFKNVR